MARARALLLLISLASLAACVRGPATPAPGATGGFRTDEVWIRSGADTFAFGVEIAESTAR